MSVLPIGVMVFAVLPIALLAVVIGSAVLLSRRSAAVPPSLAAARRHSRAVGLVALAAGLLALLVAAFAAGDLSSVLAVSRALPWLIPGAVTALLPIVVAATYLAVAGAGELTWPGPRAVVRRAGLDRRDVRTLLPASAAPVTGALAAGLVLVLAVCAVWGGGGGATFTRTFPGGSVASGPFPGWAYGVPLVVALGLLLLLAGGVLRLIVRRPAVEGIETADDLDLRRVSGRRVLRAVQLGLAVTLGGVLLFGGLAVGSAARNLAGTEYPAPALGAASAAMIGLGLLVVLAGLVLVALPAPGRTRLETPAVAR